MKCHITGCDQPPECNMYYIIGTEHTELTRQKQSVNLCGCHAAQLWSKLSPTPAGSTLIMNSPLSDSEIKKLLE